MTDTLTVLHSVHKKHAAKQFTLINGKKGNPDRISNKSYGKENYFCVEPVPVGDFTELNTALDRLSADPFAFIIRDEPLPHTNLNHTRRWARPHGYEPATFAPMPRHWLPVDLDHIAAPALTDVITDPEAAIEYLVGLLPPELHDVKCRWQLTSSQGLPGSEGLLSVRLYYWLSEPQDNDALKRWAAAANALAGFKLIDPVLYHPIQAIYTAAPLFRNMADPLPRRCGVRDGREDEACLIVPPPASPKHLDEPGEGYEPGQGVEAYLAQIGKPNFREPLRSAIASYIATYGAKADCEPVKQAIRDALALANSNWQDDAKLSRYGSDQHLEHHCGDPRLPGHQAGHRGTGRAAAAPRLAATARAAPEPAEPDPEEIDRIKTLYPLPAWITPWLQYYPRRSGEVWVHRVIERENKQTKQSEYVRIPVCSPFSVAAWLRLVDLENAYGVRLAVADRDGIPRQVDFHRGELARLGASEIRARLMEAGMRIANGGEAVIVEVLKEAKPPVELAATGGCGWYRGTSFLTPDGEEIQ
jgi:hypothetical protein